jgi:mannose-1-phosphate guanylyltransferase
MKIIIFAGGTGRRLWPISRQASPKQFESIVGDKSTVRMTVDRVKGAYGSENIFISSNEKYLDLLQNLLPELSADQFIGEPVRRDLAAAVGLSLSHMNARFGPEEPVAIIWGDNYMTDEDAFLDMLNVAESIITEQQTKMVYLGETPRFANSNIGWIGLGNQQGTMNGRPFFAYQSWHYRPPTKECERMFASEEYVWNMGYFVTTPGFIVNAYKEFQPQMWLGLSKIIEVLGTSEYKSTLHEVYPSLDVMSFDDAIVQHIEHESAVVISGSTGWSDPGTLYALKEAINPEPDSNVELGLVAAVDTTDSLLYNYEEGKLLAAVGLDGFIVVNMEDTVLVVHKDNIRLVKELVNQLTGTEFEKYS